MRHPEVAGDLLARVAPFLVADDDDPLLLEAREATDHRGVVAEEPIAVELDEIVEQELDEIARVRPLGVPRQLCALPGRQARVGPLAQARQSFFELRDLLAGLRDVFLGLERGDPVLEIEQRLLEVKRVRHSPR